MKLKYTLGLISAVTFLITACNKAPQNTCGEVIEETYLHQYGVPVPEQDWNARGESGQVISTFKNGIVVKKKYSEGILDGDTTYTFPNSHLIDKVETYSKGILAKEVQYYQSGVPIQETNFNADGTKNIKIWYENGSPKSIENYDAAGLLTNGQYYDNRNQLEARIDNGEGVRNMRDAYGQLLFKDTIQGGALTTRLSYHPNGSPKDITPYVNDAIEGQRKTFFPSGEPNAIEQWSAGKQDGITILFQNGEKISEITYVNGTKTGIERRYRDGVEVISEISWKNDQKHGPASIYVGEKPQTEWFYQDKPVSKSKYDSMNGALAS